MKSHNVRLTKKRKPKVHRRTWGDPAGPARRVFIGIRMEGEAADVLAQLQEGLPAIPLRLVPKIDLHLTLVPPWMERDIEAAAKRMRDALERPFVFPLKFRHLSYGPDPSDPFLVWVSCEATKPLLELKRRLLKAFELKEEVPFTPHITIARLRGSFSNSFKEHHVGKNVSLLMSVGAVELLGSPHKGGAGYETLKKVRLHREEETPR